MMSVAEESFNRILDLCCDDVISGRKVIDECLRAYPEQAHELEPLLRMTITLKNAREVKPSPEFRSAAAQRLTNILRNREANRQQDTDDISLMLQLKEKLFGSIRSVRSGQTTRSASFAMFFIAVLFAGILLTSGVAIASAKSLPGDLFYPTKEFFERVGLALAGSQNARVSLQMDLLTRRIEEAERLIAQNRTQSFEEALDNYDRDLREIYTTIFEGDELAADDRVKLAGEFESTLEENENILFRLYASTPEQFRDLIHNALKYARAGRISAVMFVYGFPNSYPVFSDRDDQGDLAEPRPTDLTQDGSSPLPTETPFYYQDTDIMATIFPDIDPNRTPEYLPDLGDFPFGEDYDWLDEWLKEWLAENDFDWPDTWPPPPEWFEEWLTAQPGIPTFQPPEWPDEWPDEFPQDGTNFPGFPNPPAQTPFPPFTQP